MTDDDDLMRGDLTIDGIDLLEQLRQGQRPTKDDATITVTAASVGRWSPPVATIAVEQLPGRSGGVSRLQIGVVVATFALGAALGLAVGLGRGDNSASIPDGGSTQTNAAPDQ